MRAIVQRMYICVCETREETRRNGTYKSHNNLIDPVQSSRSRLLNSSMLGLRLAGKCFCGGGSDLFVASGLSNGSSGGSAVEFMSGERTSDQILSFINNVRIKVMRPRITAGRNPGRRLGPTTNGYSVDRIMKSVADSMQSISPDLRPRLEQRQGSFGPLSYWQTI